MAGRIINHLRFKTIFRYSLGLRWRNSTLINHSCYYLSPVDSSSGTIRRRSSEFVPLSASLQGRQGLTSLLGIGERHFFSESQRGLQLALGSLAITFGLKRRAKVIRVSGTLRTSQFLRCRLVKTNRLLQLL